MSMPYPNHAAYQHLYARYFKGQRTEQMVAMAGDLTGKNVLDLCGGGGRLSALALAGGAKVTLVDESPLMATSAPPGVTTVFRDAQTWLSCFCGSREYDAVFCQQAINYWLDKEAAADLAEVVKPGGVVVFNTFNRQPSTAPAVKQYEIDGVQFVEASWMTDDNMVQHVQMREGEPPHTTRFRWIPEKDFKEWLGPYFSMCEIRDGASSVWCCTRNL